MAHGVTVTTPHADTRNCQGATSALVAIGPRVVGRKYYSGGWQMSYVVERIDIGSASRIPTSDWSMTVRWRDGTVATHDVPWNPRADRSVVNGGDY